MVKPQLNPLDTTGLIIDGAVKLSTQGIAWPERICSQDH